MGYMSFKNAGNTTTITLPEEGIYSALSTHIDVKVGPKGPYLNFAYKLLGGRHDGYSVWQIGSLAQGAINYTMETLSALNPDFQLPDDFEYPEVGDEVQLQGRIVVCTAAIQAAFIRRAMNLGQFLNHEVVVELVDNTYTNAKGEVVRNVKVGSVLACQAADPASAAYESDDDSAVLPWAGIDPALEDECP